MRKPAIGLLTHDYKNKLSLSKEMMLKLCNATGADVVLFDYEDINYDIKAINAGVWTKDGFVEELVEYPHWVYLGSENDRLRLYFREEGILLDDFVLDKKDVNDELSKSKFAAMVIPSMYTHTMANVLTFALMWEEIIIKPLVGARGEGINSLKATADGGYFLTDAEGNARELDYAGCLAELKSLYGNNTVILEPRMKFLNKDGQIMDFRVNVQKNGEGKWETMFIIPRTSRDKIVSNFSAGGYASLLDVTLDIDYGENAEKVRRDLEYIAEEIPAFMEEKSKCNMLSLGIDVGFDVDTLQPYIIEINYVPKLTFPDKSRYISTRADYFLYLTKQVESNK